MSRVKISLPEKKLFQTDITLLVDHINYGGHLGNDQVLALCHEARIRFLESFGANELDAFGVGIIMADAMVMYKAEGYRGDNLSIKIFIDDINQFGFSIFYQLLRTSDDVEIARVKTGIICFDYQKRKISKLPSTFKEKLQ